MVLSNSRKYSKEVHKGGRATLARLLESKDLIYH